MFPALRGVCAAEVKLVEQHWWRMWRAALACGVCQSRSRRSRAECLRAPLDRPSFITPAISLLSSLLSLLPSDEHNGGSTHKASSH